jgi:CubicO group peptidase (beta-lactamase class C family)
MPTSDCPPSINEYQPFHPSNLDRFGKIKILLQVVNYKNIQMKLFNLLFFLTFATQSLGQIKQDKEILGQVDKLVSDNFNNFAPGCQVLIAKKGQIIYEKGFGTANLELNVAVKPEMVFRIGSITKQFTAVAILQLVEKGQISLTDSLQKFIKTFHFKGKTITIENLLTHTSGIRGYEELDAKVPNAIRVDFAAKTVIDSLDKLPLAFEPNTRYEYSNSNYFLLGYIIEQVSGKAYPQYLKDHILLPAGLNSTYYENQTEIIPNRTSGYTFSDGNYWNAEYISMSLVYSAGALLSNVRDLYKWHQTLYNGQILQLETLLKATKPYKLSDGKQSEYGYGFFVRNENGINSIGHGGAIDGFRATAIYYPDHDVYIACFLNSDRDNEAKFFQSIANIILDFKTEPDIQEIRLGSEILNKYVGTYKNEKYKVSIKIYRANGRIYGDLSNGTGSYLMFMALTNTNFILPDIKRIKTTADFILDNGKVIKLIMTQEEAVEFLKIE